MDFSKHILKSMHYPRPFANLIKHFSALPSIGPKMAERLVLYLFKQNPESLRDFSENLQKLTHLNSCKACHNICENDICLYCQDTKRDASVIAVVEDALDIIALERTGIFHGRYHVLGGTLGPIRKQEEDTFTLSSLIKRIEEEHIQEVILAFNPTIEGDMTALYLKQKITPLGVTVTRLARGLATGGDIEYADEESLASAITNRK